MGFSNSFTCVLLVLVLMDVAALRQVNDSCASLTVKARRFQLEIILCDNTPMQHRFEEVRSEVKADLCQRVVGEKSKLECRDMYIAFPEVLTEAFQINDHVANLLKRYNESEQLSKLARHTRQAMKKSYEGPVTGGLNARPREFPHMASLGYGEWSTVSWLCGGSLISVKFVLTAAHCINTELGPVKYVRLGDLDLYLETDPTRYQDFTVARSIVYPKYKFPSVYHDIAIIELSGTAMIDDFVRPGCLNTEENIADEEWSATGWGKTSYLGKPATFLQVAQLKPLPQEECQRAYAWTTKNKLRNGIDYNSQLCAGGLNIDTCKGDSGGPLQIKNDLFTNGHNVIGVTSFGKACGVGRVPSVYTRVSFYIEWIESIVWPL